MKTRKALNFSALVILIINIILAVKIFFENKLMIPFHFNMKGEVIGYSNKNQIWIYVVIAVITYIAVLIYSMSDSKQLKDKAEKYNIKLRMAPFASLINLEIMLLFLMICLRIYVASHSLDIIYNRILTGASYIILISIFITFLNGRSKSRQL